MKRSLTIGVCAFALAGFGAGGFAATTLAAEPAGKRTTEDYIHVPMPAGVQVVNSELEGPVFADAAGHTLYTWAFQAQRNRNVGDTAGRSECNDVHYRETAGIAIPDTTF